MKVYFEAMKGCFLLLILLILNGCAVTETLVIQHDGSGSMTIEAIRDEKSFMALHPDSYQSEEVFDDNIFVFKDIVAQYVDIFEKLSADERKVYGRYKNATLREKRDSFAKDFRRVYFSSFNSVQELPDLFKTYEYVDNIKNNYALSAERHDNDVSYFYDGKIFRRKAIVTNGVFHQEKLDDVAAYRKRFEGLKIVTDYTLIYRFPKRIKSVSHKSAVLSENGQVVTLKFDILEASENPDSTSFEVEFY